MNTKKPFKNAFRPLNAATVTPPQTQLPAPIQQNIAVEAPAFAKSTKFQKKSPPTQTPLLPPPPVQPAPEPTPEPMSVKSKAIRKETVKRKFDPETCTIVNIEFPRSLKDRPEVKKKYRTRIEYQDAADGKIVRRYISFGTKGIEDYADNGDENVLIRNHKAIKSSSFATPDKPNFYRMHLLNSGGRDVSDAYITLRRNLGLDS